MLFAVASYYLHLPLLIVLISLVYSATRYEEWPSIFDEAFRWGLRMALFLVSIGAAIWAYDTFFSSRG